MTSFSDAFFDALGAWQQGWGENPDRQAPIREALLQETALLPEKFKGAPPVFFRKRHLYKSDLLPLVHQSAIDDGACSWTTSRELADKFKDQWRPEAVTGAILRHQPRPQDIVLNIPSLWDDPKFVTSLADYEKRGGAGATAIRHFRGERDQFEIIASSPLIITDIVRFSGKTGSIEPLLELAGVVTEESVDRAYRHLGANGIYEGSVMKVEDDAAQRVVQRVVKRWSDRLRELKETAPPQ